MLLKSVGVEHLNVFQRLVFEFKRRISETLNFTSPWQSKCVGGFCLEVRCSDVPLHSFRYPAPNRYLAPTKSREWTLGWCSLLGSQTGMFPQAFAARTCNTMKHHHLLLCLSLNEQHIQDGFLWKQAKMLLSARRKICLCIGKVFPWLLFSLLIKPFLFFW